MLAPGNLAYEPIPVLLLLPKTANNQQHRREKLWKRDPKFWDLLVE